MERTNKKADRTNQREASTTLSDLGMRTKPGTEDIWLRDAGGRGEGRLEGRITPAGERVFYYRYTGSSGKRVRLPIGPYDSRGDGRASFTVQQARDVARGWAALYRNGVRDLREHFAQQRADAAQAEEDARRAAEAARVEAEERERLVTIERERRITLRQLFERWRTVELQPRLGADGKRIGRKDGGQYTEDQFERHVFPLLADRPATEVRRADLLAILDTAKAAGKLRTANVLLADLKQMFRFALAREIVERNPLDTVTRREAGGPITLRDRVLSVAEIAQLNRKLPTSNLSKRSVAALWLLLATGARIGELMGAVWADMAVNLDDLAASPEASDVKVGAVDLVAGTWHLPTTKNERDHTIHLSPFAIRQFEALNELRTVRIDANGFEQPVPWVFPNQFGTGPVCVKSFGKQISDRQREPEKRMINRARSTQSLVLPGGRWTAHDLRRTAGTMMAAMGISGDVIDECLNHVIESRVRRTYIHDRRPQEQARAFDALGAKLEAIIAGNTSANHNQTRSAALAEPSA